MRPVLLTLLAAMLIALVATGVVLSTTPPAAVQPIAFNHSLHIQDVGAECTDCHLYAVSGERATIPNLQTCGDCHSEPITDSAEEAKLTEYLNSGEPIPWQKVYWVPDHVYFSHRRHTAAAEIECETCHGAMSERVEPLSRPLVPISMEGCIDCHERSRASTDCIDCHR